MTPQEPNRTKFDALKIIAQLFSYARHFRIMVLMGAVGLLSGITYYLYVTPTYSSSSLVTVHGFGTPLRNQEVPEFAQNPRVSRAIADRFRSQRIQLAAAKEMGLVGEEATYEDVARHVPAVRVSMIDPRNLEVSVVAYQKDVVRKFAEVMVRQFQNIQEEGWREFRDEALNRYSEQMEELNEKITENVASMASVEREQNLTEATLEQQGLLEIPKQIARTREQLARLNMKRETLSRIENGTTTKLSSDSPSEEDIDTAFALLSLLSSFKEDSEVEVGDVINRSLPRNGIAAKSGAEVIVEPSEVESISEWKELEKRRRILISEISDSSKKFLPDHPEMQKLNNELAEIDRSIIAEYNLQREKFDLDYQLLTQRLEEYEARRPEYWEASEEIGHKASSFSAYAEAQRMWDLAREQLSQKLASITLNENYDWVQIRFKGHLRLRDEVPVSPNKMKLLLLSLIVGAAGAVGLPTLLNLFDTSATNIQQLEEATGLNGIGIVPLTSKEFLEEVHRSPAQGATIPNYLLECFRVIRSNIVMHPNHHGHSQVVLITSSRPQEGKTTQAANLAWAFHSMGERTLLIDCDLRRGRVHGVLGLENSPGMTRLLMGECSASEAIQNTGLKGFDAIPRGPVIAGTTEILCQTPFEQLIALFRKHYDRIVIDSPPVLGLSESTSLQRLVDGTVLVVRAEKTSRKDVIDTISLLKKSNTHFFGFVLNAVDLSKASNYYYYYYYSAPYYDQFEAEEAASLPGSYQKPSKEMAQSKPAVRAPQQEEKTDVKV